MTVYIIEDSWDSSAWGWRSITAGKHELQVCAML